MGNPDRESGFLSILEQRYFLKKVTLSCYSTGEKVVSKLALYAAQCWTQIVLGLQMSHHADLALFLFLSYFSCWSLRESVGREMEKERRGPAQSWGEKGKLGSPGTDSESTRRKFHLWVSMSLPVKWDCEDHLAKVLSFNPTAPQGVLAFVIWALMILRNYSSGSMVQLSKDWLFNKLPIALE